MIQKKYTFIPESQLKASAEQTVFSVTITKSLSLYIAKFDVDMYNLNKKVVRIYADIANKTIAWKEIKEGSLKDLKDVRTLNTNPVSGAVLISVGKLLNQMGIDKSLMPIRNIPVTVYKDTLVDQPFNVVDLRPFIKAKNF